MSEPYTPTTEELRILYVSSEIECPGGATHDADDARANAEFDRWMLEHDRQVAERAWDEAVEETHALGWLHDFAKSDALARNPHRAAKGEQKLLDPKPWLFISDQVFGEFRSDHDEGYNSVSGTYWTFSPRPAYSQDREDYAS